MCFYWMGDLGCFWILIDGVFWLFVGLELGSFEWFFRVGIRMIVEEF